MLVTAIWEGLYMQRAKLDLQHLVPMWERKFDNLVSETEFDRLLGSDVDFA